MADEKIERSTIGLERSNKLEKIIESTQIKCRALKKILDGLDNPVSKENASNTKQTDSSAQRK